ncbi:myosin regulatory light chain sqh-like [Aphis gossypii]|uniref:myosin regulatory light chain sqh-like n=1 Tax=Aphis gossypii TaxID=80765 RepID=UPI002158EE90|nr:myosin regulatory light chain sqh-like [Aphis gossypii]XP_050065616.1 myosin regulatory light chain sqh-like [Aphis gossypii]
MSLTKSTKSSVTKKRAHRELSNVIAMFDHLQIQDFRRAFNLVDQNNDGLIDKKDLYDMLISLGIKPNADHLVEMINDVSIPINFQMFLTLFSKRLRGTDPEDVIKNAFSCFDENNEGFIDVDRLRELLVTMGDRFTDEDVDEIFHEAPISEGKLNYIEFIRVLKHGAKEIDNV